MDGFQFAKLTLVEWLLLAIALLVASLHFCIYQVVCGQSDAFNMLKEIRDRVIANLPTELQKQMEAERRRTCFFSAAYTAVNLLDPNRPDRIVFSAAYTAVNRAELIHVIDVIFSAAYTAVNYRPRR